MRAFVGLDLSLKSTGVAVITGDREAQCFSFGYGLAKDAGNYAIIKRYLHVTQQIVMKLKEFDIQCIAMENYGFGGKGLAVQCELGGIVKSQLLLALKQVPVTLPSTVIRKLLLGHAKPKDIKQLVASRLIELGYPLMANHDQSDALAVAHVVRQLHIAVRDSYEKKVMAGLADQKFRG